MVGTGAPDATQARPAEAPQDAPRAKPIRHGLLRLFTAFFQHGACLHNVHHDYVHFHREHRERARR